jgi:hypothetical protein
MNIPLIFIPLIAYIITQSIKSVLIYRQNGRLRLSDALRSGGMPSVHSATSMSLLMAIGKTHGLWSSEFAIVALLAAIVIYDAVGVRYAVSKHAVEINNINAHLFKCNPKDESCRPKPELSQYIGHTIPEAVVGATLGALIGVWLG